MSRTLKIAFWATVAGQIILLLAFIAVKENTLRSGTSVLLQTVPIDPRSLLQGDYAILDYEIAEFPNSLHLVVVTGQRYYVELVEDTDGVWRAVGYYPEKPGSDRVFIAGTVKSNGRLEFGIDTFFLPEGSGRLVETARDVKVRVSVDDDGKAVIEDLIVDGFPFDPARPPSTPVKEPPPPPRRNP